MHDGTQDKGQQIADTIDQPERTRFDQDYRYPGGSDRKRGKPLGIWFHIA